jgi:hypothetical protein
MAKANNLLQFPVPAHNLEQIESLRRYTDVRLIGLRAERWSYWQHWRQCSEYLLPRRGRYLQTPNQATRGNPVGQRILNETPILASRVLAAGLMAGLTSPARPWFRLRMRDMDVSDNTPVRMWLDECTTRMLSVLSQSNAYLGLHVIYEELGVFGTGCLLIEEDSQDIIRVQVLTVGEYYLGSSGRNQIDTLYREYVFTVAQLVERYGLDRCSESTKSCWEAKQLDREMLVVQSIEPNDDRAPQIPGLKGRKYRSFVYEWGQETECFLELKGYHETPFCAPRWHVIGNDSYGRSPGMDCLATSKSLQKLEMRQGQAIDKVLNPPVTGGPEMRGEAVNLMPGGVTYSENPERSGLRAVYQIPPDIKGATEKIGQFENRIKSTFFVDLFQMISELDTVRTATEIIERKQEKMLMLGPFLERSQFELINPFIDRLFSVMLRAGLLPRAPQEVANRPIDVECISTLADAQKSTATTGIERLVAFVGNLAAAKPEALDNVDIDETVRVYADLIGVTQKLIVAQQKRDALRKQRSDQAAQAAALQNSIAGAQGAKTLSETDVGGGQNALQKMIGGAALGTG